MSRETELDELRALQRKAYGRDGGLTEAESRRLRELEAADRSEQTAASSTAAPTVAASADPAPLEETADPEESTTPEESTIPEESTPPEPLARALQRHAAALLVAFAVVLAGGIGAGWALFAPREAGIPLTSEQQQRRAELASAPFDPSSIRAVAKDEDALAWYGTQKDGESICLILDVGTQSQSDCAPADDIARGLWASLTVPPEVGDDDVVGGDAVFATLVLSTAGEPMVGLQRMGTASALGGMQDAERERAETLMAEGFELGLSVAGRFRGDSVWIGDRLTAQGATERCLIVDAEESVSCEPFETALQDGISAQIIDADPAGSVTGIVVLEVRFTDHQTPYLTITEASAAEVAPGDTVRVEAPPGDPILVEPPGRGTED